MRASRRFRLIRVAISLFVSAALCATATAAETLRDIAYGDRARNQLDLYLPDGIENPALVVFIHGGRWFRNDKTQIELHDRVTQLNAAGFAIASINYTFSDEDIWPAQLNDLRKAFDFLRSQAAIYGYDADRIAVWGQSSGAHLALWATFDQSSDPDTRLSALISWYAPSDLFAIIPDRAADEVPDRGNLAEEPTPESLLVGKPVPDNKDLADAASPLAYLQSLPETTEIPPTLLVHGTADFVISPLQTLRLYEAMNARPGTRSVTLRLVEGAGHGGDQFDAEVQPVIAFLTSVLDD